MATLSSNSTKEAEKIETTLKIDNFKKPVVLGGLYSIAQKFLTLLFTIPGTYPDHPNLGVNINQYLFEYLEEEVLTKIQEHIRRQVDEYLPNSGINLILVQKQEDDFTGKNNTIGIAVSLVTSSNRTEELFYFITREIKKGKSSVIVDYGDNIETYTVNKEGMIY